jgi:hypothetical protein
LKNGDILEEFLDLHVGTPSARFTEAKQAEVEKSMPSDVIKGGTSVKDEYSSEAWPQNSTGTYKVI